jgi:hypothetical protein
MEPADPARDIIAKVTVSFRLAGAENTRLTNGKDVIATVSNLAGRTKSKTASSKNVVYPSYSSHPPARTGYRVGHLLTLDGPQAFLLFLEN